MPNSLIDILDASSWDISSEDEEDALGYDDIFDEDEGDLRIM